MMEHSKVSPESFGDGATKISGKPHCSFGIGVEAGVKLPPGMHADEFDYLVPARGTRLRSLFAAANSSQLEDQWGWPFNRNRLPAKAF